MRIYIYILQSFITTDFRVSQWLILIIILLMLLHGIDVGNVVHVSEQHVAFIFWVRVQRKWVSLYMQHCLDNQSGKGEGR
jgi:hypothetical protein